MQEETVFFDRDGVRVTRERFAVHEQVYDLEAVLMARQGVLEPSRLGPIITAFFGVAGLFNGTAYIPFGVALLVAALVWWTRQKAESAVVLKFPSGEARVLKSLDGAYVAEIVDALQRALAGRA